MIVLLVILFLLGLAMEVVAILGVIGKFVRVDRAHSELDSEVFDEFEKSYEVFKNLAEDFKNLETSFQNLRETVEKPSEVFQRIEQAENLIGVFNENLIDLKSDVELLLRVDKEHPVLAAPVERSKGGRPRKDVQV